MRKTLTLDQDVYLRLLDLKVSEIRQYGETISFSELLRRVLDDK